MLARDPRNWRSGMDELYRTGAPRCSDEKTVDHLSAACPRPDRLVGSPLLFRRCGQRHLADGGSIERRAAAAGLEKSGRIDPGLCGPHGALADRLGRRVRNQFPRRGRRLRCPTPANCRASDDLAWRPAAGPVSPASHSPQRRPCASARLPKTPSLQMRGPSRRGHRSRCAPRPP